MSDTQSLSHAKHQFLFNKSPHFITLIDKDYRYEIANDAYCWAMGKPQSAILGHTVEEVWGRERFERNIKDRLDRCLLGEEIHFQERFTFGPFERTMRVSMYPYRGDDGENTHVAVFNTDVSRVAEIEAKLSNYEYRDPTTGLFNRRSMDVILDMEIEKAQRPDDSGLRALMFVSLQNLNIVTQTYGHHIADLLLENTGIRIRKAVSGTDYVFRFEGSDIAVIIDGIRHNTDVAPIAKRIYDEVSTPYRHGDVDVVLTCVIGISVYPDDATDRNSLIQSAISARVEAERRRETFLLYNRNLHRLAFERMERSTALNRAFEAESFEVYYHPIVNAEGTVVGAESLLRLLQPDGTPILPDDFVPLAEENGLIRSIDKWVIYNVCRQVSRWNSQMLPYATLNISAATFGDPDLVEMIRGALRSAGNLDPRRIKLEVTESQCMGDPKSAIRQMSLLQGLGVDVWIDDFGTGHSSLSYLRRLPAPIMKIDREFVEQLVDSPEDMVYLSNIINTVRSQRKDVVVEGIETAKQHDLLLRLGCSYMQGFHYSTPVPSSRFQQLLQGRLYLPTITA